MSSFLLLLLAASVRAADGVGGLADPFSIGDGVRGLGMGGAAVASAGGVEAISWNPARLAEAPRGEASAAFRRTLAAGSRAFLGAAWPHPSQGSIGLALALENHASLDARDEVGARTGSFGMSRLRIDAAYARAASRTLAGGASLHLERAAAAGVDSWAASADLGAAWRIEALPGLTAGGALRDLIPARLRLGSLGARNPLIAQVGLAYARTVSGPIRGGATVEADAYWPISGRPQLRFGAELRVRGVLSLRAGLDRKSPTAGIGVRFRDAALDLAIAWTSLGALPRGVLSVPFGRPVADMRRAREKASRDASQRAARERRSEVEREAKTQLQRELAATAGQFLRQGVEHFRAGRLSQAQVAFEKALAWDTANATAWKNLDIVKAAIVKQDEAERKAQVSGARKRAATLRSQGRNAEAVVELQRAKELVPKDGDVARELGEATAALRATAPSGDLERAAADLAAGRAREAVAQLRSLVAREPGNTEAQALLSRAEAAAVEVAPSPGPKGDRVRAEGLYLEGIRLYTQGKLLESAGKFREARAADPSMTEAAEALARCEQRLKSLEERRGK